MSEVVGVEKAATRTQAVDGPTWAVCGEREAGHCTCQRSVQRRGPALGSCVLAASNSIVEGCFLL